MKLFSTPVWRSWTKDALSFGLIILLLASSSLPAFSQRRISGGNSPVKTTSPEKREREEKKSRKRDEKNALKTPENGEMKGEKIVSEAGVQVPVYEIMARQSAFGNEKTTRERLAEKGVYFEREGPEREDLPQNPNARSESRFPFPTKGEKNLTDLIPEAPQPIGMNFDTVTGPTETGAFPPDTMGAVGPSQFVVFVNGRIRTFNKTTGLADGVMNFDPDIFFAPVMTPIGGGVLLNFTSDPNVRYDRLSGRWFMTIIDVPCTNATCTTTAANRVLIAVSDAGSNSAITGATVWTLFQFQSDTTNFNDYPSLGIDANALYIGGNMFSPTGTFVRTDGWVIPKAPILAAGPITVWHFTGLVATSAGAGPYSPRGVDNVDPTNTGPTAIGYFIGVDNATFSTLMIRRITDPSNTGSSPTVSANISLTVPTTTFPNPVTHLGNTGGNNGRLDSLDDRLYAAVLRNGRLWTAHNIRVSAAGAANTAAAARNAVRWYELQNLNTTPTLVQSGTLFDNAATLAAAQQYWIPSITVSGQGHAALGCSTAGTAFPVNALTTGRLVGDTLGTMRNGPGQIAGYSGNTIFAYNPPADSGGASGRRWGDYSFTSLDPLDDMTIWTVQQYVNGTNTYGARVAQLMAPPPANIANGPDAGGLYDVQGGMASVNVTINGTSVSGSGFYDPGPDLGGGALPFNHITASVSGSNVTVNSVVYNSPTSIILNLNTVGATGPSPESLRDLTITNPDGQQVTRAGIINIMALTAANVGISGRVMNSIGRAIPKAIITITGEDGIARTTITNGFGYYSFDNIAAGQTYIITAFSKGYHFNPRVLTVTDQIADLDFISQE